MTPVSPRKTALWLVLGGVLVLGIVLLPMALGSYFGLDEQARMRGETWNRIVERSEGARIPTERTRAFLAWMDTLDHRTVDELRDSGDLEGYVDSLLKMLELHPGALAPASRTPLPVKPRSLARSLQILESAVEIVDADGLAAISRFAAQQLEHGDSFSFSFGLAILDGVLGRCETEPELRAALEGLDRPREDAVFDALCREYMLRLESSEYPEVERGAFLSVISTLEPHASDPSSWPAFPEVERPGRYLGQRLPMALATGAWTEHLTYLEGKSAGDLGAKWAASLELWDRVNGDLDER